MIDQQSLREIIKNDDVESFKQLQLSVLSSTEYIQAVFQDEHEIFQASPNIHMVAAFYSANKILQFLDTDSMGRCYEDKQKRSLSHFAAAGGNLKFFKDKKTLFLPEDKDGYTFVHYAANYNQKNILEWAVKQQISLEKKSKNGTALRLACQNSYLGCIEILCQGQDVRKNLKNPQYATPVLLACLNNRVYEAIPILMEAGLDPGKQVYDNWPLFFFGAASNSDTIPKELIRRGVDVNMRDSIQWTALHAAISKRRKINVQLLLDNGANPLAATGVKFMAFQMANAFHPDDTDRTCAQFVREAIKTRITLNLIADIIRSNSE